MQRLSERLRDERGASAVLVGVLMIALLGFAGIAVEVGSLYGERVQLQNGADAAALAIGQECARGATACTASATYATASANGNAFDNAANYTSVISGNSVTVQTTTRTGTGGTSILLPLASFFGLASKTVHAHAKVAWGAPSSGTAVLPIAMSYCEFLKGQSLTGVKQLLRSDENRAPCAATPGGFGWLDPGSLGGCSATFSAGATQIAGSDPGNNFPGACSATMTNLKGQTVLVPIYDTTTGTGQTATYHIYGFAAFQIDGWRFAGGGSPSPPMVNTDPSYTGTLSCTGNCRGIQGRFVKWGFPGADSTPSGPNLGASAVQLTE